MAELGSFKDSNAQRLRKADRLRRAQSVQLADPMIGYPRDEKIPTTPVPVSDPPSLPAAVPAELEERTARDPATGDLEERPMPVPLTIEPQAETIAPVRKDSAETRETGRVKTVAPAQPTTLSVKLTFQFSEAIFARVEHVAKKFGVSSNTVLVKASKAMKVENGDFRGSGSTPRVGPTFRYTVSIPEARAEAWIKAQDPLRIKERPGSLLRIVALNAFDRAAVDLLQKLESETL